MALISSLSISTYRDASQISSPCELTYSRSFPSIPLRAYRVKIQERREATLVTEGSKQAVPPLTFRPGFDEKPRSSRRAQSSPLTLGPLPRPVGHGPPGVPTLGQISKLSQSRIELDHFS